MRRKRTKQPIYNEWAIGEYTHKSWGLVLWNISLKKCLDFKGRKGLKILEFTPNGLQPRYKWKKKKWKKE